MITATALKVSLARPRERALAPMALHAAGARVILGVHDPLAGGSLTPAAHTLFGPRGAAITADGALWVADTGHHRLLGWPSLPEHDEQPATWLIGQPDFSAEGRNAHGDVGAASLNVPTGVCACGEGLAVADAWNHRVLVWHRAPRSSHQEADVVLGQADFRSGQANRGCDQAAADSLNWPYGVFWDGARLWVADTGNRRVLRFDGLPQHQGQAADLVLGQPDFAHRDENAGGVTQATMRWPHAVAVWQGHLCVADAGNNRLLLWARDPARHMERADLIVGQDEIDALDHNGGEYWPSARCLNMPYGLAVHDDRLFVADTANSRVLRFDAPLEREARAVAGQASFADKGDNRWLASARDSLCWPYALAMHGSAAIVVDSGNNRVLLWEVAP